MLFTKEKHDFVELSSKQNKFKNKATKIRTIGNLKEDKIAYYSFIFFGMLAAYICSTFIGGVLGLIIGITINFYEFFIFPIMVMIIFTIILKMEKEKLYKYLPAMALIIYFLLSYLCVSINKQIWDFSSDSLNYHEPMIINLFHGWNPVYNPSFNHTTNIWDAHYPKANAIFATMIYKITGKIAGTKILSTLVPIISAGFIFSFIKFIFRRKNVVLGTAIALIGFVLTLINPVNIEEFLTFYVDSTLGGMIIILCIIVLYIVIFDDLKKFKYISLGIVIPFLSNIKFTGLIYCTAILGAMFIFYLFFGSKKEIKNNFIYLFSMFIFTFFVVGFNPYITNIILNANPFYPLMGPGHTNILAPNVPIDMRGKNTFIQNIYSLIANASIHNNGIGAPVKSLKELFIFNSSIAKYYSYAAPTVRGFGILSFLIQPISIICLIVIFIKERKRNKKHIYFIILFIVLSIVLVALEAGGYWWARYIPYFWIVPVVVSIMLILYERYIVKFIGIILIVLMICNTLIFIPAFKYKEQVSNDYKYSVLSENSQRTIIKGSLAEQTFENQFNEYGIKYNLINSHK